MSPAKTFLVTFDRSEACLAASRALPSGWRVLDLLSPHEADDLIDTFRPDDRPDIVRKAALAGAALGCATALGMQYYASVVQAPLDVGGRPLFSLPSFVPIIFILTVLFTALTVFATWMARLKLPWPAHPVFIGVDLSRPNFYLWLEAPPREASETVRAKLQTFAPLEVHEVSA